MHGLAMVSLSHLGTTHQFLCTAVCLEPGTMLVLQIGSLTKCSQQFHVSLSRALRTDEDYASVYYHYHQHHYHHHRHCHPLHLSACVPWLSSVFLIFTVSPAVGSWKKSRLPGTQSVHLSSKHGCHYPVEGPEVNRARRSLRQPTRAIAPTKEWEAVITQEAITVLALFSSSMFHLFSGSISSSFKLIKILDKMKGQAQRFPMHSLTL